MNALNNRPRRAGTFFLWLALCGAGASCSSSGSSPSSGEDRTGAEGEACFANGTCFDGLACLSNRCVVLPGSSSSSGTSSGTSSGGMTGSTSGGSSSSSGGLLTSSSGGSSSGLGITSSSSSGGMAGSSSSSGGMPGGSAATLFLQDVHETLCARLGACGSGDDQPADCARRSASVLEGWAQLDDVTVTASAASCLAGLAALSCAEVLWWDRVSPSNLEMRFLSHRS